MIDGIEYLSEDEPGISEDEATQRFMTGYVRNRERAEGEGGNEE